jgi:hypothetical protein
MREEYRKFLWDCQLDAGEPSDLAVSVLYSSVVIDSRTGEITVDGVSVVDPVVYAELVSRARECFGDDVFEATLFGSEA